VHVWQPVCRFPVILVCKAELSRPTSSFPRHLSLEPLGPVIPSSDHHMGTAHSVSVRSLSRGLFWMYTSSIDRVLSAQRSRFVKAARLSGG
jgi:hypothetical protein